MRISVFVLLSISVLLFIGKLIHDNRVVATADGNAIYYNGMAYEEIFEVFEIKTGRCLGTLVWQDESNSKIYEVKGKPDFIYVSFLIDHRIYKKINS